jgi:hypothetical protein
MLWRSAASENGEAPDRVDESMESMEFKAFIHCPIPPIPVAASHFYFVQRTAYGGLQSRVLESPPFHFNPLERVPRQDKSNCCYMHPHRSARRLSDGRRRWPSSAINDSSVQHPPYSCISTVPPALTLTSLHPIENAGEMHMKALRYVCIICNYEGKLQIVLELLRITLHFDGVN